MEVLQSEASHEASASSSGNSALSVKELSMEKQQEGSQLTQIPKIYANSNDEDPDQQIDASASSEVESLKNALSKCVLCSQTITFEEESKLLECLHLICANCAKANENDDDGTQKSVVICQLCSVTTRLDALITNQLFSKLMEDEPMEEDINKEVEEEKKCTGCDQNLTATSWCIECKEYICQECVMAHQRFKITKDHTIKSKEDVTDETDSLKKGDNRSPIYCSIHTKEELTLFCEVCDQLNCRDCQIAHHRDHKYKFIHEIATETRSNVSTLLKEVTYKRVLLKSAMKVIEDRQVLIAEKKTSLNSEIADMVMELTNAINARGKQLIKRLTEVCELKLTTLKEKKTALDQLSKLTDHCIQFTNFALEKGSDMELLYTKRAITNHLQRIKSRRADIPNPDIPVRIQLASDKVSDLKKVISSIGGIIVDGKPYPSSTPPSESSTPSTPVCEPSTEPKQTLNPSGVNLPQDVCTVPSAVLGLNTFPANSYINQTLGVSLTPQQQAGSVQLQSFQGPLQIPSPTQNYVQHFQSRSSPKARGPYNNLSYNGRMPQQMMMGRPNPQQQVTSSTHPNQLHMGPDSQLNINQNLRGLLAPQPPPYRPPSNPPQYRYPTQQQQQQRFLYPMQSQRPINSHNYQSNAGLLSGMQARQQSMQQQMHINTFHSQQMNVQSARWHIPQSTQSHSLTSYSSKNSNQFGQQVPHNDSYKIMLKNHQATTMPKNNNQTLLANDGVVVAQNSTVSHAVSSSMPKTPSPVSHGKGDETEKSLDKFCQKSLNDLMMTIAKLDSNGIMVIPEQQKGHLDSTQVDSSTDEVVNTMTDNSSATSVTKDDPNEDWCAVCMDGGDAVLCCDKCPKVFHLYCHIPSLKAFPNESETWQCMLCTNVLDCSDDLPGEKMPNALSPRDLRVAQRIVLELYCQYEQSLPFREIVSPEIIEYHRIIKKPIALDIIREKLKLENENHYNDLKQLIEDIRLMFKNAYTFNSVDSQVYQEARSLEDFFEKLLTKWIPAYTYDPYNPGADDEEDAFPPNRKYRRIIDD